MDRQARNGLLRDLGAAVFGVGLITAAILVGFRLWDIDYDLVWVKWPPLSAIWNPHYDWGTPAAILLAIAAVIYGPVVAARLRWRVLLLVSWLASMAWIWSLAMIDGWFKGIEEPLTTKNEYLAGIERFANIPEALRTFNDFILMRVEDNWPAHIAGHPPGATLTFVFLDRIGLSGGAWASTFCITIGASAIAAVLITVRALSDETLARRAAPFLVFLPGAVWMGVSADAYFAGVTAWAVALLTLAATDSRYRWLTASGAGLLFGWTCYLSYGLTLFAIIALAVLLIARSWRPIGWVTAGALVVPVVFTAVGFYWWDAYSLLTERYVEGAGGTRLYSYWVWANLAVLIIVTGLATVVGLRRCFGRLPGSLRRLRAGASDATDRLVWLIMGVGVAIAVADLSGMSKSETERIWLPFAVFLASATALLPERGRRFWLALHVLLPLLVNHLLKTSW